MSLSTGSSVVLFSSAPLSTAFSVVVAEWCWTRSRGYQLLRDRQVRSDSSRTRPHSMTRRIRALVVAVLATAAAPLHAQTAPATTGPSVGASPAPARPAPAPITYDRTGVGDTSMFAPLDLTAPNVY